MGWESGTVLICQHGLSGKLERSLTVAFSVMTLKLCWWVQDRTGL